MSTQYKLLGGKSTLWMYVGFGVNHKRTLAGRQPEGTVCVNTEFSHLENAHNSLFCNTLVRDTHCIYCLPATEFTANEQLLFLLARVSFLEEELEVGNEAQPGSRQAGDLENCCKALVYP